MLSRLVQRVIPRAFTLTHVAAFGLRPLLLTRQQLVARNFMTTSQVEAERAAKSKSTTKDKKPSSKSKKGAAPKKRKTAAKPKAKKARLGRKPKKVDTEAARLKAPLKSIKVARSELPPKRNPTAYSIFLREQYEAIGKTGSAQAFSEHSKEIAQRWHKLSDAEKQAYTDRSAKLAEDYHKARDEYFESIEPRILRAINVQRKAKGLPVHRTPPSLRVDIPLPAYILFTQENSKDIQVDPELEIKEAFKVRSKKLGEMWRNMSEQEKQPYKDRAKQSAEKYRAKTQ